MSDRHDEEFDADIVRDEAVLLLSCLQGEGIATEALVRGVFYALKEWMDSLPSDVAGRLIEEFATFMSERTPEPCEIDQYLVPTTQASLNRKRSKPI
jgi:hypothetical protein